MELIALLFGLFFLATLFMPWVNHFRFGTVREDIANLQKRLRALEAESSAQEVPQSTSVPKATTVSQNLVQASEEKYKIPESKFPANEAVSLERSSLPRVKEKNLAKEPRYSFEQNIATKLPVWVGAISLICAAFFLVKYSIELGWMGPMVRVSLGGAFGAILIAVGQWIVRREYIANSTRIAQGLVGAGLVALYVSLYAAINLYHFMPSFVGFGGMVAVTALAVILSLRHGQPIAVFGLVGGLLTPALVGSQEPNTIAMFTYLFLLFSGMFTVLARKGWWVLAIVSLFGVFSWAAFWFMAAFDESSAFVPVIFAMAVASVVLAVTGKHVVRNEGDEKDKHAIHVVNLAAIAGGILTIIWLSIKISLTLFDWSMLGLLSMAAISLAYFRPDIYQRPLWIKLGADLVLFYLWAQNAPLADAMAVIAGMCAVYVGGSTLIMRRVSDPRFWAAVQSVTAVSLYSISYFVLDLPVWFVQSFSMFWGVLGLLLAGLAIYQAADIRAKYKADNIIQEHLVAIYALAASAFISLGLCIELPWAYVPPAIAAQIASTAWIYQRTEIDFLKKIMLVLAVVFAAMNYEQILLFANIAYYGLAGEAPGGREVNLYILGAPLFKLGVPALLISLALWLTVRTDRADQKLIHVLFAITSALVLATAYYVLRGFFHAAGTNIFTIPAGFVERGEITIAIAVFGAGIVYLINRFNLPFLIKWGRGAFHLAMLRLAYFDLFIFNPFWSKSQFVGDMPVLNGITLTFGAGAVLVTWAVYNKELIGNGALRMAYKILGFSLLFAFSSLTIRQYFHGGNLFQDAMSPVELYSYSVAWLVTGIALLATGIHWRNKTARMASLVFMILTVLKVFLLDASELEGLFRVFSFLGLGLSLIGLSFFYTKFVFRKLSHAE